MTEAKTVNLNLERVCGYCGEEQKVYVKTKERVIRNIRKVPNGLYRCTSCTMDSISNYINQQQRLKKVG